MESVGMRQSSVERVAQTHYMIRPILEAALEAQRIVPTAPESFRNYADMRELWRADFGERFFDMSTLLRLAVAVEVGMRDEFVRLSRLASHATVKAAPLAFQRLDPQHRKGACALFATVAYQLPGNSQFATMRELFVHRHLYAHRAGLVDDRYILDLKQLTQIDITSDIAAYGWPAEDVYWFRPLDRLPAFLEAARHFFLEFPA
jgi:hypothetical protein